MRRVIGGRGSQILAVLFAIGLASRVDAQDPPHQHPPAPPAPPTSTWHLMQDGVAFFTLNDQGGPRGERDTDFDVQNWWMGMASRPAAGGTIQFNVMFSLEPATLGSDGYREIFQTGETLDGLPL